MGNRKVVMMRAARRILKPADPVPEQIVIYAKSERNDSVKRFTINRDSVDPGINRLA